ncbi:hypothetical protein EYF80_066087 [Liparis tanakae]|uniref:Uncharacterized protein n=1 Tax=Liparis tanakae TaxID=230148 RepID=A0A4Z2E4X6_9TELE|nr:hypothetical protein EYF80_066087 [Liparis tanakae]
MMCRNAPEPEPRARRQEPGGRRQEAGGPAESTRSGATWSGTAECVRLHSGKRRTTRGGGGGAGRFISIRRKIPESRPESGGCKSCSSGSNALCYRDER